MEVFRCNTTICVLHLNDSHWAHNVYWCIWNGYWLIVLFVSYVFARANFACLPFDSQMWNDWNSAMAIDSWLGHFLTVSSVVDGSEFARWICRTTFLFTSHSIKMYGVRLPFLSYLSLTLFMHSAWSKYPCYTCAVVQ